MQKVSLSDGTATMLASADNPGSVAIDGANVYWIDNGSAVMSVPVAGGPATVVAPALTAPKGSQTIAVDATGVYWLNGNAVMKAALGGGPPVTLASASSPVSLSIDGAAAYWLDGTAGTVMKVTKP